jgi:aromatic-L-amino-acid/L-tryptophan decarboxylase
VSGSRDPKSDAPQAGEGSSPPQEHPEPDLLDFRDPSARPALEELGRLTWGTALDYLFDEAARRPVSGEGYPQMRRRFFGRTMAPADPPEGPTTSAELFEEFRTRLAPMQFNAHHPGAFAYFTPPALPMSIAGETLAQWLNQGVDIWHAGPAASFIEEEVVTWLRRLVGFGDDGFGVLTSGGVMANLMAMTLARDVHLAEVLGLGEPPRGAHLEGARVYASDQAHFSIARALDVLGFAPGTLRVLPSDQRFRLGAEPVARAVAQDRAEGLVPFAVASVAGSTNTGSVDRIGELADLCERERLWLHADAAYGGAALLSRRDASRVPDLARADSVTVDPHKWFFQAYDIGGLVVRRREDLRSTFHRSPEYYRSVAPEEEPLNWYQYSIEGTRRFRAFKLWLSWRHLGTEGFGRLVERTDDLAAALARRCREEGCFEVVPPEPELSVVCFRHVPGGLARLDAIDPAVLDRYQDALARALERSGEAWVSTTRLRGATYMRAGIVNYLSTEADVDRMLLALERLGPEVATAVGLDAARD